MMEKETSFPPNGRQASWRRYGAVGKRLRERVSIAAKFCKLPSSHTLEMVSPSPTSFASFRGLYAFVGAHPQPMTTFWAGDSLPLAHPFIVPPPAEPS